MGFQQKNLRANRHKTRRPHPARGVGEGRDVRGHRRQAGPQVHQAIEAEAQAQALCMLTQDYRRAYEAFVAKRKPVFAGN